MKTTHHTPPEPKDFSNNPGSGIPTLGMATGYAAGRVPGGARPVVRHADTRPLRFKTQDSRLSAAMRLAGLVSCVLLSCVSCKVIPQDVLLPKDVLVAREEAAIQHGKRGFYMPVVSWAGKFDYERQGTDEIIRVAWDDEKSFRDAMLGMTVTTASLANMAAKKAEEETARIAAAESTKKAAAANAADLARLKEANRHAEALMEFEVAPAAPSVP